MKSLSRNFLIGVGVMSLVVTVLGSMAAFVVFEQELSKRQIRFMADYVRERSQNVEKRFSNLMALGALLEIVFIYFHHESLQNVVFAIMVVGLFLITIGLMGQRSVKALASARSGTN